MSAYLSPIGGAGWQFFTNAGLVLNGGLLYTYTAGSTTPANTWTDPTQGTLNANPIVLDSNGRPTQEIWLASGTNNYKFVLKDSASNTLGTWDNITGIAASNAQQSEWVTSNLTPTYVSGTQFTVVGNQTSLFTVNRRVQFGVNSGTYYGYVSASAYTSLTTVTLVNDSTAMDSTISSVNYGFINATNTSVPQQYIIAAGDKVPSRLNKSGQLMTNNGTDSSWSATMTIAINDAPDNTIASAATVNIGAATSNNVIISGTTTITAFDTIANGARRRVKFTGILTLTYNATSLILPGAANITTANGDTAEFESLGSGNWICTWYTRANGQYLLDAPDNTIASAATVNIGASTSNNVIISGTTTITAFDTVPNGVRRKVKFTGALTLTYNATSLILPGAGNITTANGDTAEFESLGSGNWLCSYYTLASGKSVVSGVSVVRSARTSNTILAAADQGTLIDVTSGTFTQTFTAASTLGSGWFCWIRNSGTGVLTLGPSQNIDGLASFAMYTNEVRLVQCDGSVFNSLVLHPFYAKFTASGTHVMPPGYKEIEVDAVGAGGGGGSGGKQAGGTNSHGGGAGGAPARVVKKLRGISSGTSTTVTVGAGGTGGTAVSVNGAGNDGVAGGNTTFGALVTAYGGVAGKGGTSAAGNGCSASGSGSGGTGANAAASSSLGGLPAVTTLFGSDTTTGFNNIGTGGGGGPIGGVGGCSEWGGAGSCAPSGSAATFHGGSSLFGVSAGSAGGAFVSGALGASASNAGLNGTYVAGGGATGGTSGASATAGGNGTAAATDDVCGNPGAGGGGASSGNGAAGGNGGLPGGPGGGGGCSNGASNSGPGGNGANGQCIVKGIV